MLTGLLKWAAGIAAAVIAGVIVFDLTRETPPAAPPLPPARVSIDFDRIGGPYVVLGPVPGGIMASEPGDQAKAWWHQFGVSITNDCREGLFQVTRGDLALSFTDPASGGDVEWVYATGEGEEYQPMILRPTWLAPGETVEAVAVFRVPETVFDPDTDAARPYLRLAGDLPCPARYSPR